MADSAPSRGTCFQHDVHLAVPVEDLFGLFLRPALALQLVPDSGLELVAGPELLSAGALLTLRSRRFGLTQKSLQRVEAIEVPTRIVVVQERGPLKAYRLEQRFQVNAGGTLLSERIDFEPPGGILGQWLTTTFLMEEFARLYQARQEAFGAWGWC